MNDEEFVNEKNEIGNNFEFILCVRAPIGCMDNLVLFSIIMLKFFNILYQYFNSSACRELIGNLRGVCMRWGTVQQDRTINESSLHRLYTFQSDMIRMHKYTYSGVFLGAFGHVPWRIWALVAIINPPFWNHINTPLCTYERILTAWNLHSYGSYYHRTFLHPVCPFIFCCYSRTWAIQSLLFYPSPMWP